VTAAEIGGRRGLVAPTPRTLRPGVRLIDHGCEERSRACAQRPARPLGRDSRGCVRVPPRRTATSDAFESRPAGQLPSGKETSEWLGARTAASRACAVLTAGHMKGHTGGKSFAASRVTFAPGGRA
jgi:hypothetical protein